MLSVFIVICGYPNAIGSKIQSAKISDRVINPPIISSMSLIVFVVYRLGLFPLGEYTNTQLITDCQNYLIVLFYA